MKLRLITLLATSLLATTPAFAGNVFFCDNSSNENQSWATVPGDNDSASWTRARAACSAQGGSVYIINPPML